MRALFILSFAVLLALGGCHRSVAPGAGSGVPQASAPPPEPELTMRDPGDPIGAQLLAHRILRLPVTGVAAAALVDTYGEQRGGQPLHALEIPARRGTPVVAVDDGRIAKLQRDASGGLMVIHLDPDGRLAYGYAHLERYADGVREGMEVHRGDVLGYLGDSGDDHARGPRLRFSVTRTGPQGDWTQGAPVNPYGPLRDAEPAGTVTAQAAPQSRAG